MKNSTASHLSRIYRSGDRNRLSNVGKEQLHEARWLPSACPFVVSCCKAFRERFHVGWEKNATAGDEKYLIRAGNLAYVSRCIGIFSPDSVSSPSPLFLTHTHTYIHTHGLSVVGIKHANCYARILRVHPRDAEDVSTGNSALSVTSDSESGGFSLSSS